MSGFLTIWRRELAAYFLSPIAYVTMMFFLVIMGFSFWMLAMVLVTGPAGMGVMQALFDSMFFWIAMLIVVPVITMRLFADEKRSGTIELLMTAPVTDVAVVLGKFAGALSFFVVMWLPTIAYAYVLRAFSPLTASVDFGPMVGGYLGALLVGAFYISIGIFASSLTSNQIIAAIVSFALFGLYFFGGLFTYIARSDTVQDLVGYISAFAHMEQLSRGLLDTRPIVFYLSCTIFMLFVTVKVVESRKWK